MVHKVIIGKWTLNGQVATNVEALHNNFILNFFKVPAVLQDMQITIIVHQVILDHMKLEDSLILQQMTLTR